MALDSEIPSEQAPSGPNGPRVEGGAVEVAAVRAWWGDSCAVCRSSQFIKSVWFMSRRSSLWIATSTCRLERERVPAAALCRLSL